RRGTHKAPRDVMEGYTTFEWDVLCREVLKLQVHRRDLGQVVQLVANSGGRGPERLAPPLATLSPEVRHFRRGIACSGRDSNPDGPLTGLRILSPLRLPVPPPEL